MKRLLLILATACALNTEAQTIHTDTVNHYDYVDISPVVIMADTAVRMSIPSYSDNNKNQAIVYVVLYNDAGEKVTDFNVIIAGIEYAGWNGNDPANLYSLVAYKKNIDIQ